MASSKLSPLRELLKNLGDELDGNEVKEIVNLLVGKQIPKKDKEKCNTGFNLFVYLEEAGYIKNNDLNLLVHVLKLINRALLVDKIVEFRQQYGMSHFNRIILASISI